MDFVNKVEAQRLEIRYPKHLAQLLSVQFDEHSVRVRATATSGLRWNQRFAWCDVASACYVHGEPGSGNILFVDLRDRGEPARVPMHAPGAEDFYSQLISRGIFPFVARRGRGEAAVAQRLHAPLPERAAPAAQRSPQAEMLAD